MNDRREEIFRSAITSPVLTPREKVLMVLLTTLAAEVVGGVGRHGSRSMRPDGRFDFHLDYLAAAMFTSEANAKKIRQGCRDKGHLSQVSEGTFGRPSTWQALVVRGDVKYGVTKIRHVPPYVPDTTPPRGDTTSPLTYKTPDHPDPAPSSGGFRTAGIGEERQDEEGAEDVASRPTVCETHGWVDCPDRHCGADERQVS